MSNSSSGSEQTGLEVAVIGMSGRFPGARSVDDFWQNLLNGVEAISFFTDEELKDSGIEPELLNDPRHVKARGILDGIDQFDASFFGFSARDAALTDPQHRIFLECAWEALENAGYDSEMFKGRVGVFAGVSMSAYLLNLYSNPDILRSLSGLQGMIAVDKDHLSTRVSYKLNLRGPSVTLQTACSTSLVAIHFAIQSLLSGECEMAMAGGVSILIPQKSGYIYQEGGTFSPDGHCRAFDSGARGTIASNGAGVVVLKRLEDALADRDSIHAIVKGSAINNDGSSKVGYTAPSVEGQAKVIRAAQIMAEVDPETIHYVEAHGTGTVLGDPIEVAALTHAFSASTRKRGFCAIGSVKTNIGHLDTAAGVAGFIKTVLALKNRMIPASLHFAEPNPKIDFENSPFYVNCKTREWAANGTPRRAGVSSFGIGGTNAHAILEEAPSVKESKESLPFHLLLLSAKSESALETATSNLAAHLRKRPDINLADAAYTLQVGRRSFDHRRMLVCSDRLDAMDALESLDPNRVFTRFQEANRHSIIFMFPGQGAQYENMGRDLYQNEPAFREQIDLCSERLKPLLGLDLRDIFYTDERNRDAAAPLLDQTFITQPALFVIEYALARLWMKWGLRPAAMIGHSIGEYVAACLAGVFTLEDALRIVAGRGRLMQELPGGAMMAVALPEERVHALLGKDLWLAAVNGPSLCVVSGSAEAIDKLEGELAKQEVSTRRIRTSHAFHSPMTEPVLTPFKELLKTIDLKPPKIRYLSNVTGTWITAEEATDPSYWAGHLRQPVRFNDGMTELLKEPDSVLLEVGPDDALNKLARRNPQRTPDHTVVSSLSRPTGTQTEYASMLTALGQLWLAGARVDWPGVYAGQSRQRIPLPTYPFERQRYWIESHNQAYKLNGGGRAASAPVQDSQDVHRSLATHLRPRLQVNYTGPRNESEHAVAAIWQELLGLEQVGIEDDFFQLGGDSLLAVQLLSRLKKDFRVDLPLHSVLESPTIAKMCRLLAIEQPAAPESRLPAKEQSSLLVGLKPGSSRNPLFVIHPAGGSIIGYYDLARLLDLDQAVYGIRAQGIDGEKAPFIRVEEMASHYVDLLRSVQDKGPYFLGGASFGGTVAFEMAQQLRRYNQEVALLALLDTPGPSQMPDALQDDTAILAYIVGNDMPLSLDYLRQLGTDEQLTCVFEQMKIANRLPSDLDISQARAIFRIWKVNLEAMFSYAPKAYPGRVTFFRASDRSGGQPRNPELAWIELAEEGIEIYVVPGDHNSMLAQPHVHVLAEHLTRCMAEKLRLI